MKYKNKLYEFDRSECDEDLLNGYLIDYSDMWSLVNISHDDFFLNGYAIIKNNYIKKYRLLDDYDNFFDRALNKLGEIPTKPRGIELGDIDTILRTVNKNYPIFTVHREITDNEICHIGSLHEISLRTFTMKLIGPGSMYKGDFKINKKDVTRIDFGGKYEKCLWLMASSKIKDMLRKDSRE